MYQEEIMDESKYARLTKTLKEEHHLAVAKTILVNNGNKSAFMTILVGGFDAQNPKSFMDGVVAEFVRDRMFNEYIDSNLDNPWLRIIIEDINDLLN